MVAYIRPPVKCRTSHMISWIRTWHRGRGPGSDAERVTRTGRALYEERGDAPVRDARSCFGNGPRSARPVNGAAIGDRCANAPARYGNSALPDKFLEARH
ncbi:hypothetical protein Skr01_55610 [Sphaerisporangium krabiense]|nr:hypothetical protein Skr01_55610 [Sphaerisporangium krabiense]